MIKKDNLSLMNPVWSGEIICGSMDSKRVARTLAKILESTDRRDTGQYEPQDWGSLPFFNCKEIEASRNVSGKLPQVTHYTYSITPVPTLQKIAYKIPLGTRQGQDFSKADIAFETSSWDRGLSRDCTVARSIWGRVISEKNCSISRGVQFCSRGVQFCSEVYKDIIVSKCFIYF